MNNVSIREVVAALILLLCSFSFIAADEKEKLEDKHAPAPLPGVESAMLSADYCISLHDDADEIVMTSDEILTFNTKVRSKRNVFSDRYGKEDPMIRNYNEKLSIGLYMNPVIPYQLPDLGIWIVQIAEY